ncbi:hypothetical protein F5882DRAFT_502748 [Hyaloscypha sp. PMI_1271]|nr:hypothetical protein F5882DRAFT_502748 [Hyaloscypha sp. PMI_1271]
MGSRGLIGLHFVVSDGLEKPNPELRKLIRSHVMLGKNQGKKLPPRKRKTKVVEKLSSSSSDLSPPPVSHPDEGLTGSATSSITATHPEPVLSLTIPRKLGSGMSTISFADALEPGTIEVVLQLSSIAKQMLFPLERCMFFDRRAENWIAPLAVDPAYLHAMIFTAQFYFDALQSGGSAYISRRSMPHFLTTLKLLRERIANDDDQAKLSDSTVAAIMGLIGLYKIVCLREGVISFRKNAKLLVEILRCDIGIALHGGSKPIFFNNPSRDPFLPYPDLASLIELTKPRTTDSRQDSATFVEDIDHELAQAWTIMSDFCSVINFAVDSELRISTEIFLDTMTSVVYRLLYMHFETGSKDEAIRFGLIAFLCSVFLQWKHLGMSYPHFTSTFISCLVGIVSERVSSEFMVWLLMVGSVSVFDKSDDGWLKPLLRVNISLCEIDDWSEMQELVRGFMWIGLVYDKPGKMVFESTIT